MSVPIIKARDLNLMFQTEDWTVQALKDVKLAMNRGEFVSFIGLSGCGKNTFLRAMDTLATWVNALFDEVGSVVIRANNILSGFIDSIDQPPERFAGAGLRRTGRAAEAASLVAFLCGDGVSSITGRNIRLDGGLARSP